MSKGKNKQRRTAASKRATKSVTRKRAFSARRLVRSLLIALAILAVPVAWFAMEAYQARAVTDLSVIGSGEPVVVQVHEPGCVSCEQLLEQTQEARSRLDEPLSLRRVNITTASGRRFADDHGVMQSTLVLFDARGQVMEVRRGAATADELEADFLSLQQLPRSRRR